jgi:hypothetical protein
MNEVARERRSLKFRNEDEVIAEINRLRRGYRQTGKWSLAQIAWHVAVPMEKYTAPPASPDAKRTPEQDEIKVRFVDPILAGQIPIMRDAPPNTVPPETANESDIARFEAALQKLKTYPHAMIEMGPIGPVPADECRQCHLFHAAHHLSFLEPTTARREGLQYASEDEIVADVEELRRGYTQAGNWSLAQVCWHLTKSLQSRMAPGPFPPTTPEQEARQVTLRETLASGKLPSGIQAPEAMTPPTNASDDAIDAFLATLAQFENFRGPIAPHRLFGHLSDADARELNRIHCAHHLSHLAPQQLTTIN